ncbi:MAG: aldehyde dehydrogenase family protein [Alphaproteobacteria bacterium]|nr:aldehyde dehydrogenase family protein [Alphaproteobacteria bacterium]
MGARRIECHRLAKRLRSGSVWVDYYRTSDPAVPFGGFKMSGYGSERACSTSSAPQCQGSAVAHRLSHRHDAEAQNGRYAASCGASSSFGCRPMSVSLLLNAERGHPTLLFPNAAPCANIMKGSLSQR